MIGTMKKTMVLITMMLAGLASAAALRADEGSLSVSPAVVMLRGEVGQSTTQTLSFTNGTAQSLSFEMQALAAVVRDGQRLFVGAGPIPETFADTGAFSPNLFPVAPRQTVHTDVTITIPPHPAVRAIA